MFMLHLHLTVLSMFAIILSTSNKLRILYRYRTGQRRSRPLGYVFSSTNLLKHRVQVLRSRDDICVF